ncbi:HNH endonuclease signature motif containing protein [Actinomycetospora chlora]|uniref:HNH endonuclease signature motif containing protein n=1 Tax=Actinomycetospora chlora TaxID=663608 RepID=UPI0031EB8820
MAAALAGSEPVDLAVDEGFDAAERLAGWEALANWATGRLYRETAHYLQARQARGRGAGQAELTSEAVAMEVATLAKVAPRTGEVRVFHAEVLIDRLPATLAALEAGRIAIGHARVVIEQTELCDDGVARAVDAELWSRPARDRTPAQLRDLVRRIVTRLDPELVRRRPEQAAARRGLRYWSDDHGATGVLQLRLPADQARGVWAVVDAVARSAGDPPDAEKRTLEQTRGDTARDLILDGATARGRGDDGGPCSCGDDVSGSSDSAENETGRPGGTDDTAANGGAPTEAATVDDGPAAQATQPTPTRGRDPQRGVRCSASSPVRTEVRVTIGWDVLAGFSDRPGELEGHGPIPAALARKLASDPDAWWRRLLTDPVTGAAAHLDARRYRPPASMADFVRARDVTCAAPGCRIPAARCDLDHVVPYEHHRPGGGAGPTRADQLKPVCRRHHQLKTLGHWHTELAPDPDGGTAPVIIWTSPSGHRWWVRSPSLEPPPWDRDPDDPLRRDERPSPSADHPPDPFDWPRDVDSWRRREAQPRIVDARHAS